jgi:hypothetical protein
MDNASDDIRIYQMANSLPLVRRLPKTCFPNRIQKPLARQGAQAQAIRLISRMNMANSRASATTIPNTVSTFVFGDSNRMVPGKSCSIFKKTHRPRSPDKLLSFRAIRLRATCNHNGAGAPPRRRTRVVAARGRAVSIIFSESLAESSPPANQDSRRLRGTLAAIRRKSSRAGCCRIHRGFASAHASKSQL